MGATLVARDADVIFGSEDFEFGGLLRRHGRRLERRHGGHRPFRPTGQSRCGVAGAVIRRVELFESSGI
ncbi:hypothetical protein J5N97_026553 [Dioscorea zingiberensis]|uniref:Uncharacterized protein n=1 Tax=Dioscorea zingiberensis TaxID=325984 RepID=A0A9D5H6W4_9LILI|nr:hypothetical protein J5N97_026553 [Dioscorea zingiberensis]